MKPSRLLQRLDVAIAGAKTQLDADCFRGERALYLARLGKKEDAAAAVTLLHQRYDSKPNVKISGWVNLVEGLSIYFEDMSGGAHDKVRRSHALSTAAGFRPLQALSAAWLAQLDYMRHDVRAMARHLIEALTFAAKDHHAARSRASLVAAQALHHAGREDLAAVWHRKAHDHATTEGDDATISALMHNMAWLRMVMWRQNSLTGHDDALGRRHAMMGAESTGRFDELVGASSLTALHPLLRAQVLSLQEKPDEALRVYAEHARVAESFRESRLQGNLLADQAWCYAQTGDALAAQEYSALAQQSLTDQTHIDDRAAMHAQLARTYALLGDSENELSQQKLADIAWEANERLQSEVVGLLSPIHQMV